MFNNVINAWWPLLFYAAPDAPKFTKGMITLICVSVATLGVTALVWWLERREKISGRRVIERRSDNGSELEGRGVGADDEKVDKGEEPGKSTSHPSEQNAR